jgi:MoaA/NifB/PqqE/SkfB family radical SAM enzyme
MRQETISVRNEAEMAVDSLQAHLVRVAPRLFTLETTSVCNLRCVMCPQAVGQVHRPKQMEIEIFDKLRGALAGAHQVQLHGIGEPLLSAAFWKYLDELAGQPGKEVSFNTNLTHLSDAQIDTILSAGVSVINVSLDAATPGTYRMIRNHDLGKVLGNLQRLLAARNARGLAKPRIYINMTLMRQNIEELGDFIRLGKSLGVDAVMFWHMNDGPDWVVERPDWTFDYRQQHLRNFPELSNRAIEAAIDLARELGVALGLDANKPILFETVPT